jgi:uncharacterized protein YecA (UPF0149 family)
MNKQELVPDKIRIGYAARLSEAANTICHYWLARGIISKQSQKPITQQIKTGCNAICACGSGKKYVKKCCLH